MELAKLRVSLDEALARQQGLASRAEAAEAAVQRLTTKQEVALRKFHFTSFAISFVQLYLLGCTALDITAALLIFRRYVIVSMSKHFHSQRAVLFKPVTIYSVTV